MKNIPSNKIMLFLITLTILIFTVIYIKKINRSLFQLNYEWFNLKEVNKIDVIEIKYISDSEFIFKSKSHNLNNQSTYCLKGKKDYFFRFTYIDIHEGFLKLSDLIWLNNIPELDDLSQYNQIEEVSLDLKQKSSDVNISMIGDEIIFINESKYLRKEIYSISKTKFLGNIKDLYSLSYIDINTFNGLNDLKPKYIIIMSAKYSDNIYPILNNYLSDSKNKIIVVKYPNKINKSISEFNIENIYNKENVIFIDPNSIYDIEPNIYYFEENKYLTKEAYLKLAKLIAKQIK